VRLAWYPVGHVEPVLGGLKRLALGEVDQPCRSEASRELWHLIATWGRDSVEPISQMSGAARKLLPQEGVQEERRG
jgi:hypothetical protein